MPKTKPLRVQKTKAVKFHKSKPLPSKDLIIGIAIGAIVIFVFCLMMLPGGQYISDR